MSNATLATFLNELAFSDSYLNPIRLRAAVHSTDSRTSRLPQSDTARFVSRYGEWRLLCEADLTSTIKFCSER